MLSAIMCATFATAEQTDTELTSHEGWGQYLGRSTSKQLVKREQRGSVSSESSESEEKEEKVKKPKVKDRLDTIEE